MEIKVNEIQALEPIKFNYEDIKQELTQKLETYKNMVYTDENIKLAKTDRATLNKLAKAINDEKIRVNNKLLEPGVNFNNQCNELTGMVKQTSESIDKQVKAFESKIKNEKLQTITNFFIENIGEFQDLIDFDKIYNEKWLNTTYKMSDIETEILHIFTKTKTDFDVISSQFADENIQKQVKQYYLNKIDDASVLTLAILEGNKIIENNKKLEELQQVYTEHSKDLTESTQNIAKSEEKTTSCVQNKKYTIAFLAQEMTNEQMQILKKCLKENNIKYGPVPSFENKKGMDLVLDYSERTDSYGDVRGQSVVNKHESIYFGVSNLDECPEDAIIGRDLFTADDYIDTLNKEIELAKKGYTSVIVREVENEEE